ncbi:hypothetical protein JQ596_08610 [Bradyrhizobium manausense]|uniref:hypothetical protein n=1 Tax=Bradyrhizobium manausense TaxID=989370 RepID=UPI001BA781F9|nr:hypothetical protein [Bradyrhizobium manausense]MBR0825597.1 hypothetical protein [Bradyrhizobium manausense]
MSVSSAQIEGATLPCARFAVGSYVVSDPGSLTAELAGKKMRRVGCEIIESRGAIFDAPFTAFSAVYKFKSDERSEARVEERNAKAGRKLRQRQELFAQGLTEAQIQALVEEKARLRALRDAARADDIEKRIWASRDLPEAEKLKVASKRERDFYYNYTEQTVDKFKERLKEAQPHELIWRYAQSSEDRVLGRGYTWPGGWVADKYWQDGFQSNDMPSEEHWLYRRFLTATPCASSGLLMAGPTKYGCKPIWRKIVAFDEVYCFWGERCKDMWRVDLDKTFRSARELRRWLRKLHRSGQLPFLPHIACWIRDDRHPGVVFNPHVYFVLPEGHAVWKDKDQHLLLRSVIATLNKALGADAGGLANPFHGKNPLSLHCERMIVNDTSFPMLNEYVEGMRKAKIELENDPELTAREMIVKELRKADFDKNQSNTYFTHVAELANRTTMSLYLNGFRIGDETEFLRATIEVVSDVVAAEFQEPNWKQREALTKLIRSCSRWAVAHFDPRKADGHRYVGACAHLMSASDDKAARQAKGGAYAAKRVAGRNQAKVTLAIREALIERREPTFGEIVDKTNLSLNCVKKHWFSAFTQAVAMLSIQSAVKGVQETGAPVAPSLMTLKTAESIDHIPSSWRNASSDPDLIDHFRVRELRRSRLQRLQRSLSDPGKPPAPSGVRLIEFMASGPVRFYASGTSGIAKRYALVDASLH